MSRALYEIVGDLAKIYDQIWEAEGEVTEELAQQLEALEMEQEAKVEGCVRILLNLDSQVRALKAEEDRLKESRRRLEKRRLWLEHYTAQHMSAQAELVTSVGTIKPKHGSRVEVASCSGLPDEYKKKQTSYSPDKTKLREALEEGVEVPGAYLHSVIKLT